MLTQKICNVCPKNEKRWEKEALGVQKPKCDNVVLRFVSQKKMQKARKCSKKNICSFPHPFSLEIFGARSGGAAATQLRTCGQVLARVRVCVRWQAGTWVGSSWGGVGGQMPVGCGLALGAAGVAVTLGVSASVVIKRLLPQLMKLQP